MSQMAFGTAARFRTREVGRRGELRARMYAEIARTPILAVIEALCHWSSNRAPPRVPERVLRICVVQQGLPAQARVAATSGSS